MKTCRLIANIIVGIALAAVLAGLVAIIVDERCSRAESSAHHQAHVQEVKFK